MTEADGRLCLHRERVRAEWLDYNDHLNVAYFMLVFDHASEALMEHLGLDETSARERASSWVVLEAHLGFARELRGGDPLRVTTQVLGANHKRLHLMHFLYQDAAGYLAATCELMLMHVDLARRRSAPFPVAVSECVQALAATHASLPYPPQAGRRIALDPRPQ
jgi:acyl-CoA thioester hydrolase